MASSVIDSILFRDMFCTGSMRTIFSDEKLVGYYLQAEAALARAQATLGIIPTEAGKAIDVAAKTIRIDFERLRKETDTVGYPILPLVHQLSEAAGAAGGYVHWGATTQDIMDTANVLQIRDALEIVETDLTNICKVLENLALRYRDTPMAGRTHLQQALPITFGYKVAVWLSPFYRHLERLQQLKKRVLFGEFAGAAGTLASVGKDGFKIQAEFCHELGLAQPEMTWHVARDGIAETLTFLGLITGSLAKIATDVMLMTSTEFGELSEPFVRGRGASSTMPQKRNPIACELMLAVAKSVRQHVAAGLDGMIQDFERATGPWHLEWISLPESFILSSSALAQAHYMLNGLVVHDERMHENLYRTHGLIVSEAVMMALAPKIGRQKAHDVVYDACRVAIEERRHLVDVLKENKKLVADIGGAAVIEQACDPKNYLGLSGEMVDRLLKLKKI